jgi:hypothetical protein
MLSTPGVVEIGLSGLVIVLARGFRMMQGAPPAANTQNTPIRGWLVIGIILILLCAGGVTTLRPTERELFVAFGIFITMLAGMFSKWLWDALLLPRFVLDDAPLMRALLVSPLVALGAWNTLTGAPELHVLLLAYSNGFFWQTVFSDMQRKRRSVATKVRP